MDPNLIAQLVAQALALTLTIYQQYKEAQQAAGQPVKTLAEFIADADANFDSIASTAQTEIAANS